MKIKYLNNGVEDHVENQLARSLIMAGLAEEVTQPEKKLPAPVPTPQWSVEINRASTSQPHVYIALRVGQGIYRYFGHPQLVNAIHSWDGGKRFLSGFGRECPEEIRAEYERIWTENPNLRTVSAMALSINNARGDDAFRNRVHKVKGGPDIALPTNEQQATELAARGKK